MSEQWRVQMGRYIVPPDLHRTYDMDRAGDVKRVAEQLNALEAENERLRAGLAEIERQATPYPGMGGYYLGKLARNILTDAQKGEQP